MDCTSVTFIIFLPFSGLFSINNFLSFSAISLILSLLLYVAIVGQALKFKSLEEITPNFPLLQEKKNLFYAFSFISFILFLSYVFVHPLCLTFYNIYPEVSNYENYILR